MSLRDFRGTMTLLLLGLLQGCSAKTGNVAAPSPPQGQAGATAMADRGPQNLLAPSPQSAVGAGTVSALPSTASIGMASAPLETSTDPAVLTNMGMAALHSGDLPKAERLLRKALELDPNNRLARLQLALTLSRQGRSEESAHLFSPQTNVATTLKSDAMPLQPDAPVPPTPLREEPFMVLTPPQLPVRDDTAKASVAAEPADPSKPEWVSRAKPSPGEAAAKPVLVMDLPQDRAVGKPSTPAEQFARVPKPPIIETKEIQDVAIEKAPQPLAAMPPKPVDTVREVPVLPAAPRARLDAPVEESDTPKLAPPVVTVAAPIIEEEEHAVRPRKLEPELKPPSAPEPAAARSTNTAPAVEKRPAPIVSTVPELPPAQASASAPRALPILEKVPELSPAPPVLTATLDLPPPAPVVSTPSNPPAPQVFTTAPDLPPPAPVVSTGSIPPGLQVVSTGPDLPPPAPVASTISASASQNLPVPAPVVSTTSTPGIIPIYTKDPVQPPPVSTAMVPVVAPEPARVVEMPRNGPVIMTGPVPSPSTAVLTKVPLRQNTPIGPIEPADSRAHGTFFQKVDVKTPRPAPPITPPAPLPSVTITDVKAQ